MDGVTRGVRPGQRAEARRAVGVLVGALRAAGLTSVPEPELFRRAKVGGGPGGVSGPLVTKVEGDPGGRLVASGLWQRGYHVDWTRCVGARGEDGGPCSRDLLLALGWLLATGALETMLAHRAQQLDASWLEPPGVTPPNVPGTLLDRPSLRKLQWLIGSLRFQRRSLLSMQEERSKLMHRAYVNWKHTEKLFWVWMDSVVDCHATDKREACPVDQDAKVSANRIGAVCHHGNRGLERLDNMLLGLPTVQDMRREKEDPRRRRGTERADKLQAGGDSRTLPHMWPSLSRPISPGPSPRAYRPRLQGEPGTQRSRSPAQQPGDRAAPAGKLQASEVSRLLLRTEASLLERRGRSRRANRMHLQEMIGRLEDLVLIAP
ncbi:hypothetical protein NHX12_020054 [Muraenolepis orangiensis]|uniref:Tubulin epsilon and delta complex protein 1 domain-containing protein n=1 Tax=Muraenolepis orangiensis TaxID=630683 RepID=A0A9Q0EWL4_9TELE|nr:hypothetical protein NHX12_020054 [Muraenolepis orangiensis]